MSKGTGRVSGEKREYDGHKRLTSERQQRLRGLETTLVVPGRLSGNKDESVSLPGQLVDGELPELRSVVLQTLIDHVARGFDIPPSLEVAVKKYYSEEEITEATNEGMSSWQLPGKER